MQVPEDLELLYVKHLLNVHVGGSDLDAGFELSVELLVDLVGSLRQLLFDDVPYFRVVDERLVQVG